MGPRGSSAEWSEWGTYVYLAVEEPRLLPAAVATTQSLLRAVGRACSRFRPDSDLVRANASAGQWVRVDPLLASATAVSVAAAELTDGLVNPCLGRVLVALGYDADLGVVSRRAVAPARRLPPPAPDAWRELRIADDAIRVPRGSELDLGATCKAWAADLVAATLADRLDCSVLVSLGGDLCVEGPTSEPWPVVVTERRGEAPGQLVEVGCGGLATSSTVTRRWRGADDDVHHLVDPRTNRSVDHSLRTVTAAGTSCLAANVASTAALVLGDAAPAWLEAHHVSARLVHTDETTSTTGGWPVERSAA